MAPLHTPAPAPERALNLCDIAGTTPSQAVPLADALASMASCAACEAGCERFDRIYVGSYFCDRFFGALDDRFFEAAAQLASREGAALTLVAPIFGQRTLERGLARLEQLMAPGSPFDELVVNDPALAQTASHLLADGFPSIAQRPRLVRGRLMAKSARDPRYGAPLGPEPLALDSRQAAVERASWHLSMVEVDPFAPVIDATPLDQVLPLALHLPHAVLTTGHICKSASVGLAPSKAFRTGSPCRRQCLGGIDVFQTEPLPGAEPVFLTQQGRTVFFENPGCRVAGAPVARVIWTPADYGCPAIEREAPLWE